jgi:hypothetical protein
MTFTIIDFIFLFLSRLAMMPLLAVLRRHAVLKPFFYFFKNNFRRQMK